MCVSLWDREPPPIFDPADRASTIGGMRRTPFLISAILLVVGCSEMRTFQVAIRNDTPRPLTVGLVKEGGKHEPLWQSPEQAALRTSGNDERGWDSVVVQPGETRSAGPVKGDFSGMALATLRIYAGELQLSDVLAISRDSPNRIDVPLDEGRNALIIREELGKLVCEKVVLPPPSKGGK